MAQHVNLGEPYGIVAFPDDYTPEQIVADYERLKAGDAQPPRQSDLSAMDYAKQIGGSLVRGAANVAAAIPEDLAILRQAVPSAIKAIAPEPLRAPLGALLNPLDTVGKIVDTASAVSGGAIPETTEALQSLASGIRSGAEAITPAENPQLAKSFWATSLPQGVGSSLGFMAGGLAGRALKIPTWLGVAALGSASSGSDFYNDAKEHGADEGTARIASLIGNVVGTSEALTISRWLHRLDGVTGGTFTKAVMEAGKETFEEALQEGAQQLAQNFTAKELYDKDRSLLQDVVNNTGVGGVTGFLMSAITQALGVPLGRSRLRRAEAEQSREESRARIAKVIAQRESEQNAEGTRTVTPAASQEARAGEEAAGGVHLRNLAQNGVEAQPGETITPPPLPTNEAITPAKTTVTTTTPAAVTTQPTQVAEATPARNAAPVAAAGVVPPRTISTPTVQSAVELEPTFAEANPAARVPVGWQEVGGETQPAPIPSPALRQVAADVTANWEGAPEVVVVDTVDQLPQHIQERAASLGLSRVAGVADGGRVYLVAQNITDEERARRLLFHEAVGHYGVSSVFPSQAQFREFMRGVAQRHSDTPLGREIRQTYGEDPVTVGSEVIAKLAENPQADLTLWQRIIAAIRDWARRVFHVDVSDNDIAALLRRGRQVVEGDRVVTPAASAQPGGPPAFSLVSQPSFFKKRQQVIEAISNPGLRADQVQQAEDVAAVQANMVTPGMVGWLMSTPSSEFEALAQKKVDYILDRAYLSPAPRSLSTLPAGTTAEQRAKEVAGAMQMGHYGLDLEQRDVKLPAELDYLQGEMNEAVEKLPKADAARHQADYLTAVFNALTSGHRLYMENLRKAGPASANLQAQFDEQLNRAQERANEHAESSTAIRNALSAIARTIPEGLLTPNITFNAAGATDPNAFTPASWNQQVIDWALNNGALHGIVSDSVQQWLLVNDGTGVPALIAYPELLSDLSTLRDLLTKREEVEADVKAFEQWFRNAATSGKVSSAQYAQKYYKFRTGRDRALKIVAASDAKIASLDKRIRANILAQERLTAMMNDPSYVAAVREAAKQADVVVNSIYGPADVRTGLIDRERALGAWTLKGPMTGFDYVVDLYPSAAKEQENRQNLASFASEARQWAVGNTESNPLLADQYNALASYVERQLLHPSLDPKAGFTITRVRFPGTNARISVDVYDGIAGIAGGVGYPIHTVRDVLERVGGRPMRQAYSDAQTLDTVMRKVEAIEANTKYGLAARTKAILEAIDSHGWAPEQGQRWDEQVAEPVLAAGQNELSPQYEVGDVVIGSGVKLTEKDVAALKLMKQYGDAVLNAAPNHIQERLANIGVSRKAIGNGRFTAARVAAAWTQHFMKEWNSAATDEAKLALLAGTNEDTFRQVVLGYLGEFNPEFSKMNPASGEKSPLFLLYRKLANTEKAGVTEFRTWQSVVDFLADEMVLRGMEADLATAKTKAANTLFAEIKGFVKAFESTVLGYQNTDVWGGVPPEVVKAVTGNNSFTTPRGKLVAPSTFYTYSTASEQRRMSYTGSLRSLLNLKLLQSGSEATKALEAAKKKMEDRVAELTKKGATSAQARKQVQQETAEQRELGNIRYDYREILTALQMIEQAFKEIRRYEASSADHYQHAGVAAANNFFGTVKASLLSSTQAMSTNFWTGAMLGPALAHWQSGQWGKAMFDVVLQPAMWKTVVRRVAAMVEGNPMMSRLLHQHGAMFEGLAEAVIKAAADWRQMQIIAQNSGMVNPYNLFTVLGNQGKLRRTGGRVTHDDPHPIAEMVNRLMTAPGVRHVTETVKAATPRVFDNWINYVLIAAWEREVDALKKLGWAAFKARETAAAANGANWKDLTQPQNILTPGDLGLKTNKALEWYQQLFVPMGSLDAVLLDFYERTKNMSPEERANAPLLSEDDYTALALQYAAKTNIATETNRPVSMKGKGADGVWRNVVGTFMGWPINMSKQLSKALQTHSKDAQAPAVMNSLIGIATIVLLLAAVGAWNWEFGDEISKAVYGVSSARVQLGNIKDWQTGWKYFNQALVNTVPLVGTLIGSLSGIAYTGRGSPFDLASLSPHIGFVSGAMNTVRRIIQTHDASLPLMDFTRQWLPLSKIVLNRLPIARGIVDQQNAVRSLNASAPPGTEIKWGKSGGGDVKYGPANDEVTKLIASAYEAVAHGGDPAQVTARMNEAIQAYVAAGRSPTDAVKALSSALASKEPIRVLTGREMTPEEEARWVARMTKEQKADYDRAVAAFRLLGAVTGKDLEMVAGAEGGQRPVGKIPSVAPALGSGPLGASVATLPGVTTRRRGLGSVRRRGLGGSRKRAINVGSRRRRTLGPKLATRTTLRRRRAALV